MATPPVNGFMNTFVRILLTSIITVSVAMAGWLYTHTSSRVDRLEETQKELMFKLAEISAKIDMLLQDRYAKPSTNPN